MDNIIIQPDTPLSTLTLFDADKKALEFFASCIELEVKEGRENALRIEALAKKTITTMQDILSRIKTNSVNEAAKYGERPFMYANCEMHYCPTFTKYEYQHCNDRQWDELQAEAKAIDEKIKARETFLKAITARTMLLDEPTGELLTINPPLKKQTMGVKVTIK
jgi:hypothetical protein